MLTYVSARSDLEHAASRADPGAALRAVARLRRLIERLEAEQVLAARREGLSWQDVAERLGVTKQTVHRKYRHLEEI
jgi:DNA-directed RNA polymerase specialized sigma24 family protein